MRNVNLQQALDRSSAIQEQTAALLNDPGLRIPKLPDDQRTKIASSLFLLTVEHAFSVTFLCQNWSFAFCLLPGHA